MMADPSVKPPAIETLLSNVYGRSREESIRNDVCIACTQEATSFRDELSAKEFTISGLCQACQDSVFSPGQFEDEDLEFDCE